MFVFMLFFTRAVDVIFPHSHLAYAPCKIAAPKPHNVWENSEM